MSNLKGSVRRQWVSQYDFPNDIDEASDSSRNRTRSSNFSPLKNAKSKLLLTIFLAFAFAVLNFSQDLTDYNNHGDVSGFQSLRSLSKRSLACGKKTPYISPAQAAIMPDTRTALQNSKSVPSHITLCQELLKRNAESLNDATEEDKFHPKSTFLVQEDPVVCIDWTKPHSNVMQLIASSIVAYVGERFGLQYQHNCYGSIDNQLYNSLDFDVTTIQEIIPQLPMPINTNVLAFSEIVHHLCKSCVDDFNQNSFPVKESTHQCLLFPEIDAHNGYIREATSGDKEHGIAEVEVKEELLDDQGHIVHTALESVLPLVRNRLQHAALDWSDKAHIPQYDPKSGVVITIDSNLSLPIPFWIYQQQIPLTATHISILARPDCVKGTLGTVDQAISCVQYGMELRQYLQGHYKDEVEVSFDLVSSTATSYSRMILSHTLVCPPGTISCLMPALAKQFSKETIFFESPEKTSTYHWFTLLGKKAGNVKIVTLSQQQMVIDNEQLQVESQYEGFSVNEVAGYIPVESASKPPTINEQGENNQIKEAFEHNQIVFNDLTLSNQTNETKNEDMSSETQTDYNKSESSIADLASSLNTKVEYDQKLVANPKTIGNIESEVLFVDELPEVQGISSTEGERIGDEEKNPLSKQERSVEKTAKNRTSENEFIDEPNIDIDKVGTTIPLEEVEGDVGSSQTPEESAQEIDFSSSANLFSGSSREENDGRFQSITVEEENTPNPNTKGISTVTSGSTLSIPPITEKDEDSYNIQESEVSMDFSSLFGGESPNE